MSRYRGPISYTHVRYIEDLYLTPHVRYIEDLYLTPHVRYIEDLYLTPMYGI